MMKTRNLAIIAVTIICLTYTIHTVEAQCYGCGQNSSALKQALLERQNHPIVVETNLENYSTGDKIEISAIIANPNNNTPLVIKILDPRNETQFNKMFSPSLNQSYTWTVSTVDFWGFLDSGNYTVLSQYGQDYATAHFYLNSTLVQYLYAQSPLWQFKNGMPAQDIHCHADLKLVIRAENSEPACVSQIAATKLVLQGWALPPPPKEIYVNKISITGMQEYAVGQPINATVTYSGYYWYVEPDVKILDANGTQVWFNCPFCYTRTETIQSPSFGTFTYQVREYSTNALPMINKTGTYTMVASLDNETAEEKFVVLDKNNQTNPSGIDFSCEGTTVPPPNYRAMMFPVLLMNSNSTSCVKLTYTVDAHYYNSNANGAGWPRIEDFSSLPIGNLHYENNGDEFGITSGKDFTNSFKITAVPETVDLANYPVGSNFTVTYIIKVLPNATGFYDQSIPMPRCSLYPLAVGYAADQVNSSDFSKGLWNMLNHSCVSGQEQLVAAEIAGMNYTEMKLG